MLVLGINGNFGTESADLVPGMPDYYFHDAAACLVRDGELVAAVEEERLNRIKKTTKFPGNAVQACLDLAGAAPGDVDAVGYYFDREFTDQALNNWYVENPGTPLRYASGLIGDRLHDRLGWRPPDDRLVFTEHHVCHAASALARSGMDEALVVVLDARGEEHSGTVFHGAGADLATLGQYSIAQSLGTFYESAINLIGYRFGDEYKVMGLAPYGDPGRYREVFDELCRLEPDGGYELNPGSPEMNLVCPAFFANGFLPRRKGEPLTQQHMDFAAGLQDALERIVLHVLGHWARTTGLRKLCFTGGVAHNSSLNGLILRSGLFDEVFVHPASHDAGAAEGAALSAARSLGAAPPPVARMRSASLGPGLGDSYQIERALKAWGDLVDYERPEDVVGATAELLAGGAVVAWAQGRSEFGPRALGNRSILADPRPKENQTRINAMVKKRESFRPFAPVVTSRDADAYFELPATAANYDFMSFVVPVREERRGELGAVTHVDGTARVQVVDEEANPRFSRLVTRFGGLTGTPVLLNTSFNNNAEPIVQDLTDVLAGFLTTGLDVLVAGDFVVRRKPGADLDFDDFVLRFRPVTRVSRTVAADESGALTRRCEIALDYATGPRREISARLHDLLSEVDGHRTVGELAARAGHSLDEELRRELHSRWQDRMFTLTPRVR